MISYKVKIPKNVEEVHQNVQDIADSAMNKNVMTDLKPVAVTAGAVYDQSQVQKIIDLYNDLVGRILKS